MSQSAIQDKITAIRVQWILKWAERNSALVRFGDEALMRRTQEADWNNSHVKSVIDNHSDNIEILTAVEATLRLAPQFLQAAVDDEEDDDDSYESDYGETDDEDDDYEQYNHDPLPPAQHLVLDTQMDEDPSNI